MWADIRSGRRTLSVQPWEEGTFCIFSGCYESSDGWMTYSIPTATCTIHTGAKKLNSHPLQLARASGE